MFKKIQPKDYELSKVQDNVDEAVRSIGIMPWNSGVILPDVVIAGNTTATMTDWVDQTSAFTLSAGFGTATGVDIRTRRRGDSLEIRGYLRCGTVAATTGFLQLPSGLTIDDSKFGSGTNSHPLGIGHRIPTGAAGALPAAFGFFYDGSTNNQIFMTDQSNTAVFNKRAGNTMLANSDGLSFNLLVPITEYASTSGDTVVDHGLRRVPVGFIALKKSVAGDLYTSSTTNPRPDLQIILKSTQAMTATLWVF